MNDAYFHLNEFFSGNSKQQRDDLNGVEVANRAVAECAPDSSMIVLTKREYDDLLSRARLGELKTYKKKTIVVVSDEVENLVSTILNT